MSFIGNVPAESYSTVVKDTFSGNDSDTEFTLSIPATTNSVEVLVENVQQEPTTAYTISGTTLTFTAAPVTGTNNIYVIHRGPAVQQVTPPAGVAIDASTITSTGLVTAQDGLVVDNDGATVATFDRATNDGDIVDFQKDGSTVGSIAAFGGGSTYKTATNEGFQLQQAGDGEVEILPWDAGGLANGTGHLGSASYRWKDAYFSGGVYVGGTGAANYLDDYEEGTFTPTMEDISTGGAINGEGFYTKVGNLVSVQIVFNNKNRPSANAQAVLFGGIPFTKSATKSSLSFSGLGLAYTNGGTSFSGGYTWSLRDRSSGGTEWTIQYQSSISVDVNDLTCSNLASSGNYFRFSFSYLID